MKDKIKKPSVEKENNTAEIDRLQKDIALWISDVEFWQDETEASKKTLKKNLSLIDELEEKKRLEQIESQFIYFSIELQQLEQDLQQFQTLLNTNPSLTSLLPSHKKMTTRLAHTEEQMKIRNIQLNLFINNI